VQQLTAGTVSAGNWQMNLYYCPNESLLCTTNNGNILRQKGYGSATWDYSYDLLNRLELTTEKVSNVERWHQRMKYDSFGNRWILNDTGTLIPNLEATPRAQMAGDPSPFTVKNQWNGASYDPGGNQTTVWGDGTAIGAAKYFYDAENRIKKAEVNWPVGGAGVVEHGYDGDGRRVWKKVGGVVKTTFVYNAGGQLVAEYGESGAMPCTTCYLTADHLGSTRVVWGSDGALKQLLDYAPFGEEVGANYRGGDVRYPGGLYPRPGGMGVSIEFTGKERDAETGLDYFGARYLASAMGRFTSADAPFIAQKLKLPQTWNLYTYSRNNPLRFVDPDGQEEEDVVAIDPGHGDRPKRRKWLDPGAIDGKHYEKDYALKVAEAISAALKKSGVEAIQTRTGDVEDAGEKIQWRLDAAKEGEATAFVSIHMDSGASNAAGMKVLYGNEKSKDLAQAISDSNSVMDSRGIQQRTDLGVLKFAGGPSALVEVGFINNASDREKVNKQATKIGGEIAAGIIKAIKKDK